MQEVYNMYTTVFLYHKYYVVYARDMKRTSVRINYYNIYVVVMVWFYYPAIRYCTMQVAMI